MIQSWLADAVLLLHLAFILFVVFGAFLLARFPWLVWLHLPAAAWGALIEFTGWICPLTPLENHLRRLGGEADYEGGFIAHYLLPVIYPQPLTREIQVTLGLGVIVVNLVAYARWYRGCKRNAKRPG